MKELLLKALELRPTDRYRLAFLIAESIGYELRRSKETQMSFKCQCSKCQVPLYFEESVPLPQVCADCLHGETVRRCISCAAREAATDKWRKRAAEAEAVLEFIVAGFDNQDVNHLDFRVKVYEASQEVLDQRSHTWLGTN